MQKIISLCVPAAFLLVVGPVDPSCAADISSLPSSSGIITVDEGGFETPQLADGAFEYAPAGSAWTFAGTAGISRNQSAFTAGNPDAPEGNQVLMLQQGPGTSASRSVVFGPGNFRVLLSAAQRGNGSGDEQTVRVLIDGVEVALFTPPGSDYIGFTSAIITVAAGAHTLTLEGANPLGSDNTAFVDDVRLESIDSRWSEPTTWNGGVVPGPADDVTISAGSHVLLDQSAVISNLMVHGHFEVDRADLDLTTHTVLVKNAGAQFTCGTEASPHLERFTLTIGSDFAGLENGDFSANDEAYTTFPGYSSGSNPAAITGWQHTGNVGINGGASPHTPFADNGARDGAVAFIQGAGTLFQTVEGASDQALELSFDYNTRNFSSGTLTLSVFAGDNPVPLWTQAVDAAAGGTNPYFDSGTISFTSPIAASWDLKFQCAVAGGDRTLLLDNIVLTSAGSGSVHPMLGERYFGVMDAGRADLHGADRLDWTQLGATANTGASTITLMEPVDWIAGEQIVIASTDFDAHQAETREIVAVSPDRLTLTLDAPLQFMHWGTLQTYDDGTDVHTLDQRAEVGLLTRNIKVQGDAGSLADGIGGHIMTMNTGSFYCENAELFRMGQRGILARYPFHWHHVGDASGQYLRGCAIHRSFNRIVSVHNTDNTLVEDNVGYDHIGHGYFLEDGGEVGNTFRGNLGLLTRKPAPGEEVRPHDSVADGDDPFFIKLPATFWITNPANDFVDNHAAGSEGSGFWMVMLNAPVGSYSGPSMVPGRLPMGEFRGNTSHSNSFSSFGIDGGIDPSSHALNDAHYSPRSDPFDLNSPIVIPEIHDFTGYKCRDRCIWLRADTVHLYNCNFADNGRATFFSYHHVMWDSLIVGRSANPGNPQSPTELSWGYSLPKPSARTQFRGHSIYDGPCGIVNVHFAGFDGIDPAIQTNGAAQKSTVHFAEGITFDPAIPYANKVDFSPATYRDYMWSSGLIDRDGSITGIPGARITPKISANHTPRVHEDVNIQPGATLVPEWGAWVSSGEHYGLLRLDNHWAFGTSTPIYFLRSDGPAAYNIQTFDAYSQNPVIVNSSLQYHYQYLEISNRIDVRLIFVDDGDESIAVFPNMPSETYVYRNNTTTALPQASSLAALESATTEQYWMRDNTLHIKLIGANGGYDPRHGNAFSSSSSSIRVCQQRFGQNAGGRTDRVTLADFEMGADSRGSLTANGGLTNSPVLANSSGPATGPFDATDNSISWTTTSDGDGIDESVEYRLDFPRQVWNDYPAMNLAFTGSRVEVLVVDASQGERSVGIFDSADSANIALNRFMPFGSLDEVVGLVLRFRESDWSDLALATPQVFSISQVELLASASAPYSTSYSSDIDGDGIPNDDEPPGDIDGDGFDNEMDLESDGDRKDDEWEFAAGRDPYSAADFGFEFGTDGDLEGWDGQNSQLDAGRDVTGGSMSMSTTGGDGFFWQSGFRFDANVVGTISLKMKSTANGAVQSFWGRDGAGGFAGARSLSSNYTAGGGWQLVTFTYAGHSEWDGQFITDLRFDPINVSGADVMIDWIRGNVGPGDTDGDGLSDAAEGNGDTDGDGLLDLEDLDSDNDGASDALESRWGRNPYAATEAGVDTDGDGQSDLFEMLADTSPDDAADFFVFSLSRVPAGEDQSVRVEFQGVTGRTYTVEASPLPYPMTGGWQKIGSFGPLESDTELTLDDPVLLGIEPHRFYHIGVSYDGG